MKSRSSLPMGGVRKSAIGSGRNLQSNRGSQSKRNKHLAESYKEELKKLKKMGSINYDIDDEDEIELRKRG